MRKRNKKYNCVKNDNLVQNFFKGHLTFVDYGPLCAVCPEDERASRKQVMADFRSEKLRWQRIGRRKILSCISRGKRYVNPCHAGAFHQYLNLRKCLYDRVRS